MIIPSIGKIVILKVYLEFDRPLIFSAINSDGELYLINFAKQVTTGSEWVAVRLTAHHLQLLENGNIDYRTAILSNGRESALVFEVDRISGEVIKIRGWRFKSEEDMEELNKYTPKPGVFVEEIIENDCIKYKIEYISQKTASKSGLDQPIFDVILGNPRHSDIADSVSNLPRTRVKIYRSEGQYRDDSNYISEINNSYIAGGRFKHDA